MPARCTSASWIARARSWSTPTSRTTTSLTSSNSSSRTSTASPSAVSACSGGTGWPMPARPPASPSSWLTRSTSGPFTEAKTRTTASTRKNSRTWFFVKENVIASNAHVIEDAASGYAKLVGQKKRFDLQGIVAIDARHDLVLLAVADANASSLKLGISGQVAVGDHVYSVGNLKALEGTFADGIISAVREVGADKILQITAPISPGSSGGPILDESGAVIGVAAATYKGGQNLNFAIPISHV